jgi:hypothetical protein
MLLTAHPSETMASRSLPIKAFQAKRIDRDLMVPRINSQNDRTLRTTASDDEANGRIMAKHTIR